MTLNLCLFAAGVAMLFAAFHFGCQFHPPGYGYDEERRNNRIALALIIVGFATMVSPIPINLWHGIPVSETLALDRS